MSMNEKMIESMLGMKPEEIEENMKEDKSVFPPIDSEASAMSLLHMEARKPIRRFYLEYPARNRDGEDLHFFIEVEHDGENPKYLNYWIGCEEDTTKQYIASKEADIEEMDLLKIVKMKHIFGYIKEVIEK